MAAMILRQSPWAGPTGFAAKSPSHLVHPQHSTTAGGPHDRSLPATWRRPSPPVRAILPRIPQRRPKGN